MKEALKNPAIAILIPAVILSPTVFVSWVSGSHIDFWYENSKFHKARADYLFDAANKRGLLDICKGADGKVAVLFKEDCRP